MRLVVHGVEVESQRERRLGERGDELVDEHVAEILQRGNVDLVLEARQRRLAGQVRAVGRAIGDEFEGRIGPQGVVVVLIVVAGKDAEDAHANHVDERVFDEFRIAWIIEGGRELSSQADLVIELSQQQQPGIGGERSIGNLNLDWQRREEIEVEQRSRL